LIEVGELPSVSQTSFENVRRWRDERREMIVTVRKCDRNGEVIGKNKTKFKAKEN